MFLAFLENDLFPKAYLKVYQWQNKTGKKKNIHSQAVKFMFWRKHRIVFMTRQQHSEMDVGRERSTWGEYLHSLTVRVSMIFNLPFSHVVSLTTPTLCEVWEVSCNSFHKPYPPVSSLRKAPGATTPPKHTRHGIIRHSKLDNKSIAFEL